MNGNDEQSSLLTDWIEKSSSLNRPVQASLELTYRCNQKCDHCYLPENKSEQALGYSKWEIILNKLREAGVLYLVLTGGEAMLHADFWRILQKSVQFGFHVSMISNGLMIGRDEAKRFNALGISNVTFSLYSTRNSIHDKMTGIHGSCERTKRAIELCQAESIYVGVNCLLTRNNIDEWQRLSEWCKSKRLKLNTDPYLTAGFEGNMKPLSLRPTSEQLKYYFSLIAKNKAKNRPKGSLEKIDPDSYICNAAKGKCAVDLSGNLLPCMEIRESMGNLVEHSFETLWGSENAEYWRNLRYSDVEPQSCDFNYCLTCPGAMKNESASATELSGYQVQLANIEKSFEI